MQVSGITKLNNCRYTPHRNESVLKNPITILSMEWNKSPIILTNVTYRYSLELFDSNYTKLMCSYKPSITPPVFKYTSL